MFCAKCGNELKEGELFCAECGTPAEEVKEATPVEEAKAEEVPAEETKTEEAPAEEAKAEEVPAEEAKAEEVPVEETETEEAPAEEAKAEETPAEETKAEEKPAKEKKVKEKKVKEKKVKEEKELSEEDKKKKKIILIVVIAVVAAIVAIIGFCVIHSMTQKAGYLKQLVYCDDGEIYYLKNMNKPDKALYVDDIDDGYFSAWFSEDNKYLYYYSDSDDNTISRIKVSKIKANSKRNGKYVEELGEDMGYLRMISDQKFLYIDDRDKLILHTRGKEETLAKDVEAFTLTEDEKSVYYITYDDELCSMSLSSKKEVEIDEAEYMCSGNYLNADGNFFYLKDVKEDTGDLYSVKDGKKPVKIDEDVYCYGVRCNYETGKVYYVKKDDIEKKYMDFVEDDLSNGTEIAEPEITDFFTPTDQETVMKACLDEEDLEYYSDPENLEDFYYFDLYSEWDYDDLYYIHDYEDYDTVYYCEYDEDAEEGYLEAKWYNFDQEAYDQAVEDYEAVEDLQYAIEFLQDETYYYTQYDLYSAKSSSDAKMLCEDVNFDTLTISTDCDVAFYTKNNADIKKIKLSEVVDDYYSLYEKIDEQRADDTVYYNINAKEQKLDVKGVVSNVRSNADKKLAFTDEKGNLYITSVSGGSFGKLDKVEKLDDADAFAWVDSDLYYYSKSKGSKSVLSVYKNGKSTQVAKGISEQAYVTEDGKVLTYDDDDLVLVVKDEKKEIDRNVDYHQYINDRCILYVKKGDLYLYNGSKENIRIAKDVDYEFITYARSTGKGEPTYSIGYSDYEYDEDYDY